MIVGLVADVAIDCCGAVLLLKETSGWYRQTTHIKKTELRCKNRENINHTPAKFKLLQTIQ